MRRSGEGEDKKTKYREKGRRIREREVKKRREECIRKRRKWTKRCS